MSLIFSIIAIIVISYLFVSLAHKAHFSEVIGLIMAGLFLSIPVLKDIFVSGNEEVIGILSNAGLFTLMLVSGFEISRSMLKKEESDSLILTLITTAFALTLGFTVFMAMGFGVAASLIIGVCFSITAEATKARALLQLKEIKTRLGTLLLEAGILNDILGILALSFIIYFFAQGNIWGEVLTVGGMIIAFVLGMLIHLYFNRESRGIKFLEKTLLYTVVPFFFINMAIHFSSEIFAFNIWLFTVVFVVSSLSQVLGAYLSRFFINLNARQAMLVGFGMNSKGAVEIAVAFVALKAGILPLELYSAVIATSLLATVVFHILSYHIMLKYPQIMD